MNSLRSAISDCVFPGAMVAVGGQNMLRNPVASALEIASQDISNLYLVGCNLSICGDILTGSGSVERIACGTINFEVFGVPSALRLAAEAGNLNIADQDHHSVLSRLAAARSGAPFAVLPFNSALSWQVNLIEEFPDEFVLLKSPPFGSQDVILATPLRPDVCLLHVQASDEDRNLYVNGPESFDLDLALASRCIIVTCEEIKEAKQCFAAFGKPFLPGAYVDRVVLVPGGGRPTSVPGYYSCDSVLIEAYIEAARGGGDFGSCITLLRNALQID